MVHALRESRRVLRAGGLLIDLRPAITHRRLDIRQAGRTTPLGAMHETFDEDRAANRAVRLVLRKGLFRQLTVTTFECNRNLDTIGELKDWLSEFDEAEGLPAHNRLLERARHAWKPGGKGKIVIHAPLVMRVLIRQG
jgi:hypothetical protein